MGRKLQDDQIKWILSLDAKGVQSELTGLSSKSIQLTNDNKKLSSELKIVEKDLNSLQTQFLKLAASGDTTSTKYNQLKNSLNQTSIDATNLRQQIVANNKAIREYDDMANQIIRTMRVEDMTMEQLKKRARELEVQLIKTSQSADPKAYNQLDSELKEVQKRMGDLKNGGEETASMFSVGLTKSIVGVTVTIALAKQAFSLFEDVMISNRATGIEFNGMMDGLNNALDYFKAALANMDFTNFIEGLKKAYDIGHQVSLALEDIYDRENSFKLVSAQEIAEIEELKTDLRNVNLSNKERLRIGNEIIERTKKLAETEKKISSDRVNASTELLKSQTNLTDAELEYMTANRLANEEDIKNVKKIKDLEGDLILMRKNAKTYDEYSDYGNGKRNQYYVNKYNEEAKNIEKYEGLIKKLKNTYGLTDPKQYEIASNAIDKFYLADKKMIDNYINSRLQMEQVDIKTTRSLRMTQRTIDSLTKKENGGNTTPEVRQRAALSELNKKMEIKYQKELAELKKKYRDGDIKTEAEYNQKVLAIDQAYYILKKNTLEEFLKIPLDKKVRIDIEKELATLETKEIDKQIKNKKAINKILLDANPLEKEKQAYAERLDALGLYGKTAAALQLDIAAAETEQEKEELQKKLEAFLLLEKQYQANLRKIKKEGKAKEKADSEAYFMYGDDTDENPGFQKRKKELQTEVDNLQLQATANPTFDAEMAVHLQRLAMIQEEIDARKEAGVLYDKAEAEKIKIQQKVTNSCRKEIEKQVSIAQQYAETMGSTTGNVISGQEDMLKGFGTVAIDIMFDVLSKIIEASIVRIVATSTETMAAAEMQSLATPDSVLTFGASGAARAAIMAGLITAAAATAKAALKGLLNKKSSSSSSSSSSDSSKSSGSITVKQKAFADGGYNGGYTGDGGRYEVAGMFDNGAVYHRGEYIIAQPELQQPAVISMVRALEGIRRQRTNTNPMSGSFAEGGYNGSDMVTPMSQSANPLLISELTKAINAFNNKKLNLGMTELQAEMKKMNESNNRFTRKS